MEKKLMTFDDISKNSNINFFGRFSNTEKCARDLFLFSWKGLWKVPKLSHAHQIVAYANLTAQWQKLRHSNLQLVMVQLALVR